MPYDLEWLLVIPLITAIGLAVVVPTIVVIAHSFTDWQPGYASEWIGLDNYRVLLHSDEFRQILTNQAFLLLGLPLWVFGPLVVAFTLSERVPAAGVFRTIYFFPAVAPPAILGILFAFLLSEAGPINDVLRSLGLGVVALNWLGDPSLVKPVILVVLAWSTLGAGVILYSAGLTAIPPELHEAARMDGATWWQRLRLVVLPSLRRIVELWSVILVISLFLAMFPWIFTLTRGGPGYASTTIDFDIYQRALQFGYFGEAAAEVVLLLVIVAVILTLGAVLARRDRKQRVR